MKYYFIAGEASGDLQGSRLIKELKKIEPASEIRCWGGDKMEEAGATLVKHYRELAFMGFAEVLMNLRTIFRNLKYCKEDISQYKPDGIVLIDYPGFNMRIAKWAKLQGFKVIYYISPKVWAWKESRVKSMKKYIDKLIAILPFEKKYFKEKWNWEVDYPGHPLIEIIDEWKQTAAVKIADSELPIIALLPGSRKQEIIKKLPVLLEVSRSFPNYQFVIAKAPGIDESFYDDLIKPYPEVSYVAGKTYDLLMRSTAAIITSGTATLEAALFGVPEVVVYKTSWLSYQVGKRVIRVKYISLVNLILDREAVKELIQYEMTVENIKKELQILLSDENRKLKLMKDYNELNQLLRAGGNASKKAAALIHATVTAQV